MSEVSPTISSPALAPDPSNSSRPPRSSSRTPMRASMSPPRCAAPWHRPRGRGGFLRASASRAGAARDTRPGSPRGGPGRAARRRQRARRCSCPAGWMRPPSASRAKNPGNVRASQGMRASENRRQLPGPAKPFTWAQIHARGIRPAPLLIEVAAAAVEIKAPVRRHVPRPPTGDRGCPRRGSTP